MCMNTYVCILLIGVLSSAEVIPMSACQAISIESLARAINLAVWFMHLIQNGNQMIAAIPYIHNLLNFRSFFSQRNGSSIYTITTVTTTKELKACL